MGIASGIFWIMFGLLYILYQAFKEHPSETVSGVLVCGIIVCGLLCWHFLFHALLDWNIAIGSIFGMGSITGFLVWIFRYLDKEKKKEQQRIETMNRRHEKAKAIVDKEVYDEKTLREYAKVWSHGGSTSQIAYNRLSERSKESLFNSFRPSIEKAYRGKRYNQVYNQIAAEEEAAQIAAESDAE